ncbi:hypothetical protein, conserved [Plasmodium gonderi]|uniref:Golgi apparatus membrane protein TVP23 homolog n=1 Tax=Plasmodium gonderi TaxID=77519 RepID=A0A1Y1JMQ0_PLAGO|nr:hypothetical protein, conserved [Plasmodium gonderi]GAW82497.1 hypothetical protein, conserved [Plasmodium gonderi]
MDRKSFANEKNEQNHSQFPNNLGSPMNINNSLNLNNNLSFDKNDLTIYFSSFLNKTNHPYVCFAHVFFKSLSLSIYFIGPFLFRNEKSHEHDFIITFAITLFLVSLDFYLVKNITGRFLVKMIWWIDSNEDYSSKIIFRSSEENLLNSTDKNIFWYTLYANFLIWLIQTIQMLISFQFCWLLLCLLCLFLSFYNIYNFWKCSKEQHKIVGSLLSNVNINYLYNKIFSG